MTEVRALLLSAGIGSRLRPLTDVVPKCLMPINGKPLLGYWLSVLRQAGVSKIMVNLHHHAGLVRDYVAASPFAGQVTFAEEPQLLGTGGTLLENKDFFAGGPVLMAHADNLSVFDPLEFLSSHGKRPGNAVMTMMTFATPTPSASGVVELDARNLVTAFHEKKSNPPGNRANAAVYVIERPIVEYLEALRKRTIDFSTEVIPHFLGRIFTVHNHTYHRDIGTPASLAAAQFDFPLVSFGVVSASEQDPWYGLMHRDGGRLAHDFAARVGQSFDSIRITDKA